MPIMSLMLENGRIIGYGTHEELLKTCALSGDQRSADGRRGLKEEKGTRSQAWAASAEAARPKNRKYVLLRLWRCLGTTAG